MKKLLLLFVGVINICSIALAQPQGGTCTPDPLYTDSIYGAWPDTITNFPPAATNTYYETVLNFKAPATVTAELDPTGAFVGTPIQSYNVTSVTGLPAGYSYQCNVSNCTYAGGIQGCATVYGTTATAGTYNITINLDVTVLVELIPGFPTPITQPQSFSGYKIIVGSAGLVEGILKPIEVHPNPAKEAITISGLYSQLNIGSFVITNMEGKIVKTITPSSNSVDVSINDLEKGMYYVVINHSAGKEVVKFIKE